MDGLVVGYVGGWMEGWMERMNGWYTCMFRRRNKKVGDRRRKWWIWIPEERGNDMLAEHPNSNNGQYGLRSKRSLPKNVSNVGEHTYFPQTRTLSQTTPLQTTTFHGLLCT